MAKKTKPQEKTENDKGVYMAFISKQGKTQSKIKLKEANLGDISNAIIWCDIIKERLLKQYQKMINIRFGGNHEEK